MRAFEAAARHQSFKQAADELALTPSAISHQVKALEKYLGVRLFKRLDRGLSLTDIGRTYSAGLGKAFDQLETATSSALGHGNLGALTVNMFPSFAMRWLIPRLGSFNRAYPDLEVRLISSETPLDFSSTDIDLAIHYGHGNWPDLRCDYLLAEHIFPVCSPEYLAASSAGTDPSDLRHHTLICCQEQPDEWHLWLTAAGVEGVDPERGLKLDSRMLSLQAALDGLGIAIGRRPFVNHDLAAGRLVAPFDLHLDSHFAYYLVCPEADADLAKITAFREWMVAECHKSQDTTGTGS